ncbi:MAG: phage tail tape measure protein [Sphingopyxis macrogoltabida]|uniref:Phage tail tape measure protein n=1 Tax=Sphingopyxis macrogoltabida TaxID=33050 RepID=A0A2W5KYK6_SPHMC|nr:MAG: phage tail tape measure protein [Sphingopyxis macrogoltabida]
MANQRLNAVITIGGTVTGALKSALGSTQTKLRAIGSTIRNLEREQKSLQRSIKDGASAGQSIRDLEDRYAAVTRQIERARIEQGKFKRAIETRARGKAMMGEALGTIGAVGAVAATAFVPVIHAASFEKAMLGVAKQVDGARDSAGRLTKTYFDMARQVQLLGREMPIATNELAGMVEQGARMGIAKEHLIDFTRTAAQMATALDLPSEELADSMGKIANLYGIPIPEIRRLGDAINYLDDNAISKGGDIIDFLTRTGGVAGSVRVTATQMSALGSTLLSLGERSETASTATSAFLQKLAAADKGSKKFRRALDEIGLSAERVQQGMQTDAQGTILEVIDAVNKLPEAKRLGVLVDLVGLEHSDTLAKLVTGVEEYRRQIEMAGSQKASGSVGREFAAQLAATSSQWIILKNRALEVSVNIGSVLLPAVNEAMATIGKIAGAVADWTREHPKLVGMIGRVARDLLIGVAAFNALKFAIGGVKFAFGALRVAMVANPIGLALTAIAVGAVLIYENWGSIKAFFVDLWNGVTGAAERAWNWLKTNVLPFTPLGQIVENWGPIGNFFSGLWGGIKAGAGWAWNGVKTVFLATTPLGLVVKNWGPISTFFSNMWAGIKATAAAAIDWILDKIATIGRVWQKTKEFFSRPLFGESITVNQSGAAPRKPGLPPPPGPRRPPAAPPMAGRRTAANVTNHNQTSVTIHQQPGQDAQKLASVVIQKLDARERARRGSLLYDTAQG